MIAKYPLKERRDSRLLVLDRETTGIADSSVDQLGAYLSLGDLLVFNDTQVIPARLFGQKITGGKVEILVERVISDNSVLVNIRSSKSPKAGAFIRVTEGVEFEVVERDGQFFILKLNSDDKIHEILEKYGHMPLPPYIDREDELSDQERYQTVYGKRKGAVAAPTAGLHFDQTLLDQLSVRGIEFAHVTLHVGSGTFQPVRVDNINEHKMHSEFMEIDEATCEKIRQTRARGNRVIAVGTTSVRCLETAAKTGELAPYTGETDIFIYPGYEFKVVDALITNFHLPESTLLMLVSALAGKERIMKAYQHAVEEKYRFFSYGDAMLIK